MYDLFAQGYTSLCMCVDIAGANYLLIRGGRLFILSEVIPQTYTDV